MFCIIVQITCRYSHWTIVVESYKVFRSKNNKIDEEEFDYFVFLWRKPIINCAKKGDSGLGLSFKKEKDLVNKYNFDYMIILILCKATIQKNTYFCRTTSVILNLTVLQIVVFFIFFFLVFSNMPKKTHLCMKPHQSLL